MLINFPLLNTKSRVSIVNVGSSSKIEIGLNEGVSQEKVIRAIEKMQKVSGQLNLVSGLLSIQTELFGKNGREYVGKLIVSILAGEASNSIITDSLDIIYELQKKYVEMVVITVGDNINYNFKSLATYPDYFIALDSSLKFPETTHIISKAAGYAAGKL